MDYRVLVFPSCNEPGLEVIEALLKSNKIELFAGSSPAYVEFDPSRLLLRNYLVCPHLGEPRFRQEFERLLAEHAIDLVFPTVDSLVAEFAAWRLPRTRFVTPREEIARLVASKSATYERLEQVVPVPRRYAHGAAPLPAFAKPDSGGGAKGAFHARTAYDLALAAERDLLLSEYLPGDEYTVDCLSDLSGTLLHCGVRLRGSVGRSISLGTKQVRDEEIEGHVRAIATELRIEGPWFAQFKRNAEGRPVLLEINARGGGSTGLTRLGGVNLPLLTVFVYHGVPVRVPRPRAGLTVVRRLRNLVEGVSVDAVIWDLDDTLIRKDRRPDPDCMAALYDLRNRGVRQFLLTRNGDVEIVIDHHIVPRVFEAITVADDKMNGLETMLRAYALDPSRVAVVNDSWSENLAFQQRLPGLNTLTPDMLELLGRERVC